MSDRDGDVLRVRVMDWITDSPSEKQTNMDLFQSFSKIRHLEIRLTGWTINQNSRLHVGINTVPAILASNNNVNATTSIEELTIDLECLSRNDTLITFCALITTKSTYPNLQKLNITCSGEEDMSSYSLQGLGKCFRNLHSSVTTLKFSGMDPNHLTAILYNMQSEKCCMNINMERCLSCPSLSTTSTDDQKPCPRVLPQQSCDAYEPVSNQEEEYEANSSEGYPKNLELHRVRLSHPTVANLVYLLIHDTQSSITRLALRDCVLTTDDISFLVYLLKGHSVLQELTLDQLRIRAFHDAPSWWNSPCHPRVPSPTKQPSTAKRLHTVRLLDCKGSRKDLKTVTDALVHNPGLETIRLQYSSSETCSMTIHALNALYLSTVIHNRPCHWLRKLQVSATQPSFRLHQLAAVLGHPHCHLEALTLDFGSGPYHLDILGDKLTDNARLQSLALSGEDHLDVTSLECFVSMLEDAPNLKSLELDFPGIDESDEGVLRVLESNTTLEEIRVEGSGGNTKEPRIRLCYLGLRNRLNHLLQSRPAGTTRGTLQEVLQVLLEWQGNTSSTSRLDMHGKELVFTSGVWFALIECPMMVSELGCLDALAAT